MVVQEQYKPHIFTADQTRSFQGCGIGAFIAVTAGTITVTAFNGTVVLNAFPVTAGGIYSLPMYLGLNGYTVTLAGGASGTLLSQ